MPLSAVDASAERRRVATIARMTSPRAASAIDHITVTAPTLQAGAAFVERALGVAMRPGGAHPRMGTHNLLLRLGEAMFLEVIAIDPDAAAPARPRWFALDAREPQPRLSNWVARVAGIRALAGALPEALGDVEPMTRGALDWLITIPRDGSLPLGGAAPALIEWNAAEHPAARMPPSGCTLAGLELHHPQPERVQALLAAIGLRGGEQDARLHVVEGATRLVAHIDTPDGLRTLGA
jgi:hypothetical protein